ncbi:hypothetical protein GCM10010347_19960 [Streptomyces cirratus]|uniref:Secreted protein n=1 Tax=Streptomyces cirratus TaxID=68187 RepID=A0ABQ3EQ87_9ACTN|nr:hypothetical protein [Streptomyces cirratus]GHB50443.1 hypothetical protein GCM10010347_19960 [Streptomyces cirratus]
MKAARLTTLIRHGSGRLTLPVLFVVLAVVLLCAPPRPAPVDEPADRSDRSIVGRTADVLGDTVFETGAGAARPAPRHTPVAGGPSQPDRTADDGSPAGTADGGTP